MAPTFSFIGIYFFLQISLKSLCKTFFVCSVFGGIDSRALLLAWVWVVLLSSVGFLSEVGPLAPIWAFS